MQIRGTAETDWLRIEKEFETEGLLPYSGTGPVTTLYIETATHSFRLYMKLRSLLAEKKPELLQQWFDSILSTYPSDSTNFLKGQKNPYAGSIVGQTIYEGIEGIFHNLVSGTASDHVTACLDSIVRVRAVQEFSASEAVSFLFLLKEIIRKELMHSVREEGLFEELLDIESRLDSYAYTAFDIYMQCREKLFDLKANEMRNWTYRIIKQSKMYREVKAEE